MSSTNFTVLLWIAALSSGLMAGVYFAFSTFIMRAFGSINAAHAITAMNAINKVILRSLFMPLFFGSSLVSAALIVAAITHWQEAHAGLALTAGMVYFIGMFVCTAAFNVPLNNVLAKTGPASDKADQLWSHYLRTWTRWNHLRTLSSLVTCALSIWLLNMQS
ncbi:DUF1772 domain-containing protein [Pseudomonadota bacterium]